MKNLALALLFVVLFAAACAPADTQVAPLPTERKKPTATVTAIAPTVTKAPTATKTPEVTVTPEIRQFKVCSPENLLQCRLDLQKDVLSGDFARWVKATFHVDFDPTKIKTNIFLHEYAFKGSGFGAPGNEILYNIKTSPNFKDQSTAPFRRGLTAAIVSVTDDQGNTYDEAILPVLYYNPKDPKNNILVMTAYSFRPNDGQPPLSDQDKINIMKGYMKDLDIAPLSTTYYDPVFFTKTPIVDPLLKLVWDKHTDMASRMLKVTDSNGDNVKTQDLTYLDDPTILVGTNVAGLVWYR